jgi:hypothetical protein
VSTETKVFGAFVLLCTLFISGIVFYDIYTHPADPNPAGTATILIGGTSGVRFSGDVGTLREPLGITATTPVAVETPYRRADWVIANLQKEDDPTNRGTLRVKIVKYKPRLNENKPPKVILLEEGETRRQGGGLLVMWDVPRSGQVGWTKGGDALG